MAILKNRPFNEIKIGEQCQRIHKVTEQDLESFAKASGDTNPIHLNEEYAATTQFKQRIAHGMFSGGLISALLASELPGPGTVYLGQDLQFKRPIYIGDTLTVQLTVSELHDKKPFVTLKCRVTNQDNKPVVTGTAKVMAPTEYMEVEAAKL